MEDPGTKHIARSRTFRLKTMYHRMCVIQLAHQAGDPVLEDDEAVVGVAGEHVDPALRVGHGHRSRHEVAAEGAGPLPKRRVVSARIGGVVVDHVEHGADVVDVEDVDAPLAPRDDGRRKEDQLGSCKA